MSASDAWNNIKAHLEADAESVKARIEQDLPVVAGVLERAASNPVVIALEQAAHVSALPEGVTLVVSFINGLDAMLAAQKAAAAPPADVPPAA